MKIWIDRLIKHLNTQIARADQLQSDWVYITKDQAKYCLQLAEAEDTLLDIINGKGIDDH
jgi:hypothetical protein